MMMNNETAEGVVNEVNDYFKNDVAEATSMLRMVPLLRTQNGK